MLFAVSYTKYSSIEAFPDSRLPAVSQSRFIGDTPHNDPFKPPASITAIYSVDAIHNYSDALKIIVICLMRFNRCCSKPTTQFPGVKLIYTA